MELGFRGKFDDVIDDTIEVITGEENSCVVDIDGKKYRVIIDIEPVEDEEQEDFIGTDPQIEQKRRMVRGKVKTYLTSVDKSLDQRIKSNQKPTIQSSL